MRNLFVLLFSLATLNSLASEYYISTSRVYGPTEECFVSFSNYNYYNNSKIKTARFTLYKANDPQALFESKVMQNYYNRASDSLIKTMTMVKSWETDIKSSYNQQISLGTLDQGVYILEALANGEIAQIPVLVTDYSLITRNTGEKLVCYVSNRETGKSESGYKALLYTPNNTIKPEYYKNATALFDLSDKNTTNNNVSVVAYKNNKIAVTSAYFYNYYYGVSKDIVSYIFTDRSAYRPEQTIKFKGVFRKRSGFGYEVMQDSIVYAIYDKENKEVVKKRVALDDKGSFNDSIVAEKSWKLGDYTIRFSDNNNIYYWYYNNNDNSCKFKIEEYKKPEYEVFVEMDEPQYQNGEKISASIKADYFFGAPVVNAKVTYKVLKEHYYVPWYYSYRYWWWYEDMYGSDYNTYGKQVVHHGTGELNEEGKLEFEYTTDPKDKGNYKYTVYAEVIDASRRSITGSSQAFVTYNSYIISAHADKYYYHTNEEVHLNVMANDYARNNLEVPINVKLYRNERYYHYKVREKDLVLDTTIITSKDGMEQVILPSQMNGSYIVELSSEDKKGHESKQTVYFSVFEKNDKRGWWNNNGGIQLITDKKVYNAGDTVDAMFYVPHNADALITFNNREFAHFDSYDFEPTENDSGSFKHISLPLDKDINGKFSIYIGYMVDNQYYYYEQQIAVIPTNKYLNVSVEFDANEYQPGKTATAIVSVTDYRGNPVPNADVSLATADEAIYSLYPDENKSLDKTFYNTKYNQNTYNQQNQYSKYNYSQAPSVNEVLYRIKKYDLGVNNFKLLNNQWYRYQYNTAAYSRPMIQGFVVNEQTNEAIPYATIKVGTKTFKADANGYYAVKGFSIKVTTLEFSDGKHSSKVENIMLYKNQDIDLIVGIHPRKDNSVKLLGEQQVAAIEDMDIIDSEDSAEEAPVLMSVAAERSETASFAGGAPAPKGDATVLDGVSTGAVAGNVATKKSVAYSTLKEAENTWVEVEEDQIRSDFKDAIYWNPSVVTDKNGKAKVKISLPDNLTTWRTVAKVITPNTEVGETIAKIIVTKNLLVRMETPRFMTLGDKLLIATTVHNYLSSPKEVKIMLESNGLVVKGTEKIIKLGPNDDKRVDWEVNTQYITDASLQVKALTNEESDAMKIEVPVKAYGLEMMNAASVYLSNGENGEMLLNIPDDVDMRSAYIEITTAPSVTASLLSSMDDLIGYPYGCVEQTMSRFLPNIIVSNTLQNLGGSYVSTIDKVELTKMVAQGTKRLGELQHNDGGWGWWENDQTNSFMTAYVVNGLYMATQADYPIPSDMLAKGKVALSRIISSDKFDDPSTRAYCMMVGSKIGLENIWKKDMKLPDEVNSYELALWVQAAHYADKKDLENRMVARLESAVIKEGVSNHWGGKKFYYSWQDDKVETTANAVLALSLHNDNNPLIPGAIQWLMSQKKGKSWYNTRQTAMTIFGLSHIIKKEVNPDMDLVIDVNGQQIDKFHYGKDDVFKKGKVYKLLAADLYTDTEPNKSDKLNILNRGKNQIEVKQKGKGSVFVNAKLVYFLNGNSASARKELENSPYKITRTYYKLVGENSKRGYVYKKKPIDLKSVKSGDNIFVQVSIESKSSHDYVLIEDPIPAGCEFIRDPKPYVIEGEAEYDGSGNYWNYRYWGYWNWNRWYSHKEYRDDRLSHTITNLPAGTYTYNYLMKAQIPGDYKLNPVVAQLMYYPEHRGFSAFDEFRISE